MSTYVMSDIHGCYNEMLEMLEKIGFSAEDMLIVAGDYIDRGTQSYEMLKWIENHPENVVLLRGNHEEEFLYCIELMETMVDRQKINVEDIEGTKYIYLLLKELATENEMAPFDYYGTIGKLINENGVTMSQLLRWNECIKGMPYLYEIEIKNRKYIVVHAGYVTELADDEMDDCFDTLEEFYLYARDDAYIYGGIQHGVVVAGHTPTILEEELPYNNGNVYKSYDEDLDCTFYDIDCGCAYRRKYACAKLACIRLEDEEIFYT